MGVTHNDISPTNKGTTRKSRLSEKLLPDYFKIDERKPGDFLALITEYSRHIKFSTDDVKKLAAGEDINWNRFFSQDISVVLASMSHVDIDKLDEEFERKLQAVYDTFDFGDREKKFEDLFLLVQRVGERFLEWYEWAYKASVTGSPVENRVKLDLGEIIRQNLALSFLKLNSISKQARKSGFKSLYLPVIDFDKYPAAANFLPPSANGFDPFQGDRPFEKMNNALIELRFIFRSLFNSIAYIVTHFPKYLDQSLEDKQDHHPHVALFVAFLQIFQFSLDELNSLTSRHLNFYYQEILQETPRPAVSDKANVIFELSRNFKSIQLPKGTLLGAGRKPGGDQILFETEYDAELNHAKVESLKSVFISKILEGQTWTYKLVTAIYSAPVANSKNGQGESFESRKNDWSLFGEEQYKSGVQTMASAEVGFAISSPIFALSEGNRKVKIHFDFLEESTEIYEKLLRDFNANAKEEDIKYAFFDVFGNGANAGFNIHASTYDGWLDLAEEASNEIFIESNPWSWQRITIGFMIPASSPPLEPVNPSTTEGKKFQTKFPVVKFILNPDRNPFLFTFLEKLELASLNIQVEVDKMKSLNLYNDIGRLDASQPFQAFGPTPSIGSYMLVGNAEVFRNKLSEVKFTLDWQNLPPAGFEEYYKEFFKDDAKALQEDMFKVQLTALSGHEFKPMGEDAQLEYSLFNGGKNFSVFKIEKPELFQIMVDPDLSKTNHFDNNTQSGFFRFELSNPPIAFGHHIFQERFAEVAQENAELENEEKKKFPNPPYTPLVKALTMSYKAEETVKFESVDPKVRTKFYHLFPFGSAPIYERGRLSQNRGLLIPEFDEDGYLFIGIKDLAPPQELNILFQLVAGDTVQTSELPSVKWSFLAGNTWEDMKESDLLADGTENFTRTGIVRLNVPSGITQYNELMPEGVYWLRIAIKGNAANVSRAIDIRTQAVLASWVNDGDSDRLEKPMAPGTIKGLFRKVPEVRGVFQPYPSFGGQMAETQEEYFNRVAERLRHKNRAINVWDFERLVLNQFHTISQVKASSHLADPDFVDPGKVRVIVVPGRNHTADELTPKVNHSTLNHIREYLHQNSSPFVEIGVTNPVYEFVRVNFKVKFAGGANNGYNLERLKDAIKDRICPWLTNPDSELSLGGAIEVEDLSNFIKNLPYVDFITAFAVLHFFVVDEETGEYSYTSTADPRIAKEDKEFIRSTKPWSVLIPDEDHEIGFLDREMHMPAQFSLRPVDFQGKFQITPKLIKIKIKEKEDIWEQKLAYDQNDSFEINI